MVNRLWLLFIVAMMTAGCSDGCQKSSVAPPENRMTSPGNQKQRARAVSHQTPWKLKAKERAWKYIVLHHTGTSKGNVQSIHETHRQRKDRNGNPWLGIGYHFVIGNGQGMLDGKIEPTFRWTHQIHGAHAGNWEHNKSGIGIALVGNFEEAAPSQAQLTAIQQLVNILQERYRIKAGNIKGHNEIKPTQCPGKYFPLQKLSHGERPFDLGYHVQTDPMTREIGLKGRRLQ